MSTPTPHPETRVTDLRCPGHVLPSIRNAYVLTSTVGWRASAGIEQDPNDQHGAGVIPQKAHILEQAHEVLVQALASVDRV